MFHLLSEEDAIVVAVQPLSHVQLLETPWIATHQAPLFSTVSWSLLTYTSIELVMLSSHLTLCCPLLLLSIFPSIRAFPNELSLHIMCPKYWTFNISPSSEYLDLI